VNPAIGGVDGQQMRGLGHRLSDKQTIEWITMMYG